MGTRSFQAREITPASYRYSAAIEPKDKFQQEFAQFLKDCAEFEAASKKSIYDAKDIVDPRNFRVHCAWLAALIANGQNLILFEESEEVDSIDLALPRQLIQEKIDDFIVRLYDWHGIPGNHPGEPATFKAAMDEARNGTIEEFNVV